MIGAHFDHDPWMLSKLKNALDWDGVIESISAQLIRYADGESRALLIRHSTMIEDRRPPTPVQKVSATRAKGADHV